MPKIFIGLTEIAGCYNNLRKGFEELSVECDFITLNEHRFKYGQQQKSNFLIKLAKYAAKKQSATPKSNLLLKVWWKSLHHLLRMILFIWALLKYDVFIFGYQSSFLFFYDLPILKLLQKKIIYRFNGSDSRPPYIDGFIGRNADLTIENLIKRTWKQKNVLKKIEHYADVIISYPLYSHLHERPFVSSAFIGIPYELNNKFPLNEKVSNKNNIRILHSPSYPEAKGTPRIRQAIKSLQARGYPIAFIEITGKPNVTVLNELAHCDFIIDQLYSDTPMAAFATEAAFLGKPAIVGGYCQEEIRGIYPADNIPPVHFCHPDEIEEAIEKLILDEEYRMKLGRMAKQFVEIHRSPKTVAKRFLQLIEGDIPKDWLFNPKDIRYLYGGGLSESRVKKLIGEVIEAGGKDALQLSDKRELERMFVEFAYSGTNALSASLRDHS